MVAVLFKVLLAALLVAAAVGLVLIVALVLRELQTRVAVVVEV